ncbi:Na+/H+ antiporter subunit E [Citreicella sp. C3M06]|uniref:Na+/H+ antiporter subunit E n=1 Tax=Roseobacteraceae TaxID=2854170 RepID=UPI001C09C0FB|nr:MULTISPECIES: Na+/H+ antiporter subunit E [Roseobacteraceae]MBU2961864.1 Na+/H+ antiporter subunit E [Citreicella sp. C3M06]MDO6587729.1 Na+/H+ antiporter subunit E [Salipiger sp. 1_MG-2023]
MLRRIFPHPLLTLTLTVVWLMLVNKFTLGNLFLGVVFGVFIPAVTAPYWPNRPKLGAPLMALEYVVVVLWDIIVANVTVAKIVLFKPERDIHSQWVVVPLELTSPEAITVLAGTVTMTPGTVSATLSSDGGALLVHCLHRDDPDEVCHDIKTRYERRLKEIFP